jgi:hypothetical protein
MGLQHADLVAFMLKNTPKIAHFGSTSKVFILRMPPSGRYPTLNFLQRNKKEKKLGLQQANFVNFVSMLKNTPKIASLGSTSQRGAYLGNAPQLHLWEGCLFGERPSAPPLGGVLIWGTPLYGGATRQVILWSAVKREKKVVLQRADHFNL